MIHWVKWFPHSHEDLSSNPKTHIKYMAVNPATDRIMWQVETGDILGTCSSVNGVHNDEEGLCLQQDRR